MEKKQSFDFDNIIDEFTPYVRKVVSNSAKNYLSYEDKEEIIADTFFVFWKNRKNNIENEKAYLAGIARNLVKEKFKKLKITYDIEDYIYELKYYDDIEMFEDKREKISKLKIGYKALDEKEFEIITLFYYSEKTIKDIAKKLKMSETNVKTKLFRIRKKLKKYLK